MTRVLVIIGLLLIALTAIAAVLAITGHSRACPGLTSPPVAGCQHLYGSIG